MQFTHHVASQMTAEKSKILTTVHVSENNWFKNQILHMIYWINWLSNMIDIYLEQQDLFLAVDKEQVLLHPSPV